MGSTWSLDVATAMTVSAGTMAFAQPHYEREALFDGFKIIVLLSGRLRCRIEDQPEMEIGGPTVCAVLNSVACTSDQTFAADEPVRFAIVQVGHDALPDDFALDDATTSCGLPRLRTQAAGAPLQALCRQILACPLQGPARNFYLAGKGLELAGLAIDGLAGRGEAENRLATADIERIHAARGLLLATLQDPPSLAALARAVGLNPRKLTRCYRQVFGTTVYADLQEQRLQAAFRLLAGAETSVSAAAYAVGYSPAHFSVAFRKRFGVAPGRLS